MRQALPRRALLVAVALALGAPVLAQAPGGSGQPPQGSGPAPPEPDGFRLEAYRAPTPATLRGATVVATAEVERLRRDGALLVDVLPQPRRPPELAPGTLFRLPPRDSLPGALWLVDVGYGAIAPSREAYLRRGLDRALAERPGRPIVFFCERDCWMSWNAARRALALGYDGVHWYPDGTTGWREAGLPLERVEPMPEE
jgi:PQQ-dependent catabolism-associated CXXCW motif protein